MILRGLCAFLNSSGARLIKLWAQLVDTQQRSRSITLFIKPVPYLYGSLWEFHRFCTDIITG